MKWITILLLLLINAPAHAAHILSPNGKQSTSMSFAAAAASPAAVGKTIVVRGIETISTVVTLPADVKVEVQNGGYFSYSGSGMIVASKGQINPFTPQMFGAKADDSTDCYTALSALAKTVTASGGGSVLYSPGIYRINRYKTQTPYQLDGDPAITNPDITFTDCDGLNIRGVGATISVKGDFYRTADTQLGPYWYSHKRAIVPFVFTNCANVVYDGVNVNGNIDLTTRDSRVLEGAGYGILINGGSKFDIKNATFTHIQTDGILVGGYYLSGGKLIATKNGSISNVTCEYCGRVGLSIIAARGWVLSNCRFDKTGRSTGSYGYHSPGNGIDVEADYNTSSVPYPSDVNTGDITFVNCTAIDNCGTQFSAAYAQSTDNILLKNFTMTQGADGTSSPYAVILGINGITLEDSTIDTGDGHIAAGWSTQGVYQHVILRNNTIYSHGIGIESPLEGDVKVEHNRIIGQHASPLTSMYFPRIINSKAVFKDNYLFLPAAGYNGTTGAFLSSYVSAKSVSDNEYDTDLDTSTGKYFAVIHAPEGRVLNDIFNTGVRAANNTAYDFRLPYTQGYGAGGDSTVYVNATLANIVTATLAAAPRAVWTVYGDSSDGGTTPDITTQASIAALESAGVPAANIRWLYEVDSGSNTLVIDNMTAGSSLSTPTLALAGGTFTINDLSSSTTVDNVTISGSYFLTIADATAATSVDSPVIITLAGGTLSMSNISSATALDNLLLTAGASPPSAPTGTSSVAGDGLITMHPGTSTGATSYNYYIKAGSDPTTSTYDYTGTVTDGQTKTGLTNGTAYHIGYTAVNSSGESAMSTIGTVTPAAAATPPVGFSDDFTAANGTALSTVNWNSTLEIDNTLSTGSKVDIQGNAATFHVAQPAGTAAAMTLHSNGITFAVGKSIEFKMDRKPVASNGKFTFGIQTVLGTVPSSNRIYLRRDATSGSNLIVWNSLDSGGNSLFGGDYTLMSDTLASQTIKVVFTSNTQIEIFIGGVSQGVLTHNATLVGSTLYFTFAVRTEGTSFIDVPFDYVNVTGP